MLKPVLFKNKSIGFGKRTDSFFVFFSNRQVGIEELRSIFSNLELITLKQTHGDKIVEWANFKNPSKPIEADGQFCAQGDLGLCIYTADCLPIMIHDKKICIAIHAGWKSLSQEIIGKAIKQSNLTANEAKAYIGPHIRKNHFEVGNDVADQILKNLSQSDQRERFTGVHTAPEKTYLDLTLLATEELKKAGLSSSCIEDSQHCTFADLIFHSFRRDANRSGRQISFVAKLTEDGFSKNLYI